MYSAGNARWEAAGYGDRAQTSGLRGETTWEQVQLCPFLIVILRKVLKLLNRLSMEGIGIKIPSYWVVVMIKEITYTHNVWHKYKPLNN